MAELVERREQRASEVVLSVAGRDAHVGVGERRRERVGALIEPEAVRLDGKLLQDAQGETALLACWKLPVQTRTIDSVRSFPDRLRQRHDRRFQGAEETLGLG